MNGQLSERQLRVLWHRAQGLSGPQIARVEQIAVGTVDWHERVIRHALGARNMTQAVHLAHVAGLLRVERHGDHAGYTAHLRRGEPPCEACRAGERVYRNGRRLHSGPRMPESASGPGGLDRSGPEKAPERPSAARTASARPVPASSL